jgi:hypothetical protein
VVSLLLQVNAEPVRAAQHSNSATPAEGQPGALAPLPDGNQAHSRRRLTAWRGAFRDARFAGRQPPWVLAADAGPGRWHALSRSLKSQRRRVRRSQPVRACSGRGTRHVPVLQRRDPAAGRGAANKYVPFITFTRIVRATTAVKRSGAEASF